MRRESVKEHPLQVLNYAIRHDQVDLASEASLRSMGLGVEEAINSLDMDTFKTWVRILLSISRRSLILFVDNIP